MEIGTTIRAAQATGPGEVPVLDQNGLIPEAFIPKSASGGGGQWVSLGTPAQAKGKYVEGDYYRLWTSFGCLNFMYGTEDSYFYLWNGSSTILFYPRGFSNSSTNFIGYYNNSQWRDSGSDTAVVEHWVPDA